MKKLIFLQLFLLMIFSNCARKVEKDNRSDLREQVVFNEFNPLSQFHSKKDTSELFETFIKYSPKSKSNFGESTKIESNQSLIYYVQVGLSDSYDEISQLKNQLSILFPNDKIEINYDIPFYRVLIGPFNEKREANEICSILERKNYSSIRIRIETAK